MKKVILITGGHCAGKTTILKKLKTIYPEAKFCFCDNDDRYKCKPEQIEAHFVEDLNGPETIMVAEGTRIVPRLMIALGSKAKAHDYDFSVIHVKNSIGIVKARIAKRRQDAGRAGPISDYFNNDEGKLTYEGTGIRQYNALLKYNTYPYKLFQVEAQADFSEQQVILDHIASILSPPKKLVIQIRGTNGSGKSFCCHNLLDKLEGVKLIKDGKVQGYRLKHPNSGPDIYVVGSYENECGGWDTIHTMDEGCERVRRYAAKGSVVFEGMLPSLSVQRFVDLSAIVGGLIWAILDTPLNKCIKYIEARRRNKGIIKPLNPKNTIEHHVAAQRCAEKVFLTGGQTLIYLDHTRAAEQVYEMLTDGTLDGGPITAGYRYEEGRRIALGD